MHSNFRRIVPVVVILALAGSGLWWWRTQPQADVSTPPGALKASGTIESTEITVAAELSGRVVVVAPEEGQSVKVGEVLVQLDDAMIKAQRAQALATLQQVQAALAMAQARLDQAQHGNAREADLAVAQAQVDLAQANYDRLKQPPQPWQLDSARAAVSGAQAAYVAAVKAAGVTDAQLAAGQALLDKAAVNLKLAQQNYDLVGWRPNISAMPQSQALQAATIDYQSAQANYAALLGTVGPGAQSRVLQAAAQLAQARAALSQLQQPYTDADLAAAQANLDQARANLQRLQAPASASDQAIAQAAVDQAQSAVSAAQAAIGVLDVQIAKLTISAPLDGTIVSRAVEPGEMALPGGSLLVLADTRNLQITVYVPEDRYGAIALGERASVTVDSFPGQTFSARVLRIADKAEFTPRNVQTEEGRKTTVFAVKLSIENTDGKLKAGMPADVVFEK